MIDFIKIEIPNTKVYEDQILKSDYLDFNQTVNINGGEINSYPIKSRFENLEVKITKTKVEISGSLHKLYNILNNRGEQNYDSFNHSQIREIVSFVMSIFYLDEFEHKITNLEFGFNIEITEAAEKIIDNRVLLFDYKEHSRRNEFMGKGFLKEFTTTDYQVKVYDKSKQFDLENRCIMRIEVRLNRSRLLNKYGVHSIRNILNIDVLKELYRFYMSNILKLNIIDYNAYTGLNDKDKERLDKFTNPNTWKRYKEEGYSAKKIRIRKRKFESFLLKEGLLKTKGFIIRQLDIEYSTLINTDRLGLSHIRHMENKTYSCK
ncbi:hypothetical protein ACPDHJ_02095 [Myroides sp. C8-3]|nr:hypothetical protein [Myroides odoratimimus]MDM1513728.1 hypothetical protein [Myroides odoratimimus]